MQIHGRTINAVFAFIIFACMSGICSTAIGYAAAADDEAGKQFHDCHSPAEQKGSSAHHGDTDPYGEGHSLDSSCCYNFLLTSKDLDSGPSFFIFVSDYQFDLFKKNHALQYKYQINNRGDPLPGNPVYIKNSTFLL